MVVGRRAPESDEDARRLATDTAILNGVAILKNKGGSDGSV